jgi:hypothetical protein
VIFIRDRAGIFAVEDPSHTFLNGLICLPVPERGHGIPLSPVLFIRFRIPRVAPDAFNQFTADAITLDRQ